MPALTLRSAVDRRLRRAAGGPAASPPSSCSAASAGRRRAAAHRPSARLRTPRRCRRPAIDMKAMANDERGFLMTGDAKFRDEIAERAATIREELAEAAQGRPGSRPRSLARSIADEVRRAGRRRSTQELALLRDRPRRRRSQLALGENRDLRKGYEKTFKAATADAQEDLERLARRDRRQRRRRARARSWLALLALARPGDRRRVLARAAHAAPSGAARGTPAQPRRALRQRPQPRPRSASPRAT